MVLSDVENIIKTILGDLSEIKVDDEHLKDFVSAKRQLRALLYRVEIEKLLDQVSVMDAEKSFAIVREALITKL